MVKPIEVSMDLSLQWKKNLNRGSYILIHRPSDCVWLFYIPRLWKSKKAEPPYLHVPFLNVFNKTTVCMCVWGGLNYWSVRTLKIWTQYLFLNSLLTIPLAFPFTEASGFHIYTILLVLVLSSFLCHCGFNSDFFHQFEIKTRKLKSPQILPNLLRTET